MSQDTRELAAAKNGHPQPDLEANELPQWYALLGAMLVSKEIRESARKSLLERDVPKSLLPLWQALGSGDAAQVWDAASCLSLPDTRQSVKSVALALVKELSKKAQKRFCKAVMARSQFLAKADLSVDEVASTLESWAAELRAREAGS